MSTVLDKFLRYVKIDTQSQDGATTVPSTDKPVSYTHLTLPTILRV